MQLEKYGKVKAQKFYIGDEITYQLADDDYWRTATISEIRPEEGYVLLEGRLIYLHQIVALKFFKSKTWSKAVGKQLAHFAAGWVVYGIADKLIFKEISWKLIIIPAAVATTLAGVIPRVFRHRVKKMNGRHRLRLLDLTPLPQQLNIP